MPSFQKLFEETDELTIQYKDKILHWADKFPVKDGDVLIASIEKTNSEWIQGLSIDITGSCEVNGKIWKQGKGVKMIFWEDSTVLDPKHIEIKIFTKKSFVVIQNIWESINHLGNKSIDSGHNGAAMIIEEIENGRRYHCNDGHPDENFDDIVFTIQRLKQ
ncbi:MAG: hypothetical protein HKM07_06165 [Chlamydiae bacterium]|nr:hypothetical protein [Chlamydiota bacterium]